ncbi:MAG: nickel pincer cofactor biosynthesis protein LarC [Bacteroidales bacterium]
MKILYYHCFAGISGDMNLGALADLGIETNYIIDELKKLHLDGYDINFSKEKKRGIEGTRALINITHQGKVPHRHLKDIEEIINTSNLNQPVKELSLKIFRIIAEAEAKVHGIAVNKIHFHEVGAVDSIVDIVGAAVAIDYLKPDKIVSSPLQLGGGFVKCAHGILPVPAPATTEILKGMPVKTGLVQYETTTPTGAAIIKALADEYSENLSFTIEKTGYGVGYHDYEVPNVLRVHWGESNEIAKHDKEAILIECNIDDMNPELYGYIFDKLFDLGAQDVFISNIYMKKNRPANKLSVLTHEKSEQSIIQFLLHETSTLGIRKYAVEKEMLNREIEEITTPLGKIRVKKAIYNGETIRQKPEYDDCLRISKENNIPLLTVYNEINKYLT